MSEPIDRGVIKPAGRALALSRAGRTDEPVAYGADRDAGGPSARAMAESFERPAMAPPLGGAAA